MRQDKEIGDRDFLAAVSMALLGTLLAPSQPATIPVLEHALPAVPVPQWPCAHLTLVCPAACALLT